MNEIDQPELQALVQSGEATVVGVALCEAFERHVDRLPWWPSKLDWSRIGNWTSIRLSEASAEDVLRWAETTRLWGHSHAIAMYSGREPGLACTVEFALRHVDRLLGLSRTRFLFGADRRGEMWVPAHEDFVEYDGVETLTASRRPPQTT